MIDLASAQPLQTCLVVGDSELPVDTSFRAWLMFSRILRETGICSPTAIGLRETPEGWRAAALAFLNERPSTPRDDGAVRARGFDLDEDAPYIVGSFQAAYGVDLSDPAVDMHWHRFLALLWSLPAGSKLMEIAGYRQWSKADARRSPDAAAAERRRAWALPERGGAERDALVAYQMEWFGNVTPGGGSDG